MIFELLRYVVAGLVLGVAFTRATETLSPSPSAGPAATAPVHRRASGPQVRQIATVTVQPVDGDSIELLAVPRDSALLSREWRLAGGPTSPPRGAWPRYYSRDSLRLKGPVHFTADVSRGGVLLRSADGREFTARAEFLDGMVLSARGRQVNLTLEGASRRVYAVDDGVGAFPAAASPARTDATHHAPATRPPVTTASQTGGVRNMAAIELVPGEGAGAGDVLVYTMGSAAFAPAHEAPYVRRDTLRVTLPARLRADLTDGDLHFRRVDGQRVKATARIQGGVSTYFGDSPHVILQRGGTGILFLSR